jgi:hypothetical protein
MSRQTSPANPAVPADIRHEAEPLDAILDACAYLLNAQHHLTQRLHNVGLITDRTATAALAGEDQIDAALTDLRVHHTHAR